MEYRCIAFYFIIPLVILLIVIGCGNPGGKKVYSGRGNEIFLRETTTGFVLETNEGTRLIRIAFSDDSSFIEICNSKGFSIVSAGLKDGASTAVSLGYVEKIGEKYFYIKMDSDGNIAYRERIYLEEIEL